MTTTVYFVRHAEPDYTVHDDMMRPLTERGLKDARGLIDFFAGLQIHKVLSSPFKRAFDTVEPMALDRGIEIEVVEDFRERKVTDNGWIQNFNEFAMKQWDDFEYCLPGGDCLRDVQERNIRALGKVVESYKGSSIVVGSHGTALSAIINHYDKSFGYKEFNEIKGLMPWIVKFTFSSEDAPEVEVMAL